MKNILVKYICEGTIQEDETEKGILLDDKRVFVTKEYIAIYEAQPTGDPNVYVVEVESLHNLLNDDSSLLLDIMQPLIS